jgi:hypothetical protein
MAGQAESGDRRTPARPRKVVPDSGDGLIGSKGRGKGKGKRACLMPLRGESLPSLICGQRRMGDAKLAGSRRRDKQPRHDQNKRRQVHPERGRRMAPPPTLRSGAANVHPGRGRRMAPPPTLRSGTANVHPGRGRRMGGSRGLAGSLYLFIRFRNRGSSPALFSTCCNWSVLSSRDSKSHCPTTGNDASGGAPSARARARIWGGDKAPA